MIIATFLENILYARIIKGGGCRGPPPPPENIFLKLPYIKENRFLSLPPPITFWDHVKNQEMKFYNLIYK